MRSVLLILFLTNACLASDKIYYAELNPQIKQGKLFAKPKMRLLQDARFSNGIYLTNQITGFMDHLIQSQADHGETGMVFKFPVLIGIRQLDGTLIEQHEFSVTMGYASGKGLEVRFHHNTVPFQRVLPFGAFNRPQEVEAFLDVFVKQAGMLPFAIPKDKEFLLELAIHGPHLLKSIGKVPSQLLLARRNKDPYQLGITYCRVDAQGIDTVTNFQARHYLQTLKDRRELITYSDQLTPPQYMDAMRSQLGSLPSDRLLARQLLNEYRLNSPKQAQQFAENYQPFLASYFKGDTRMRSSRFNYMYLEDSASALKKRAKRRKMAKKVDRFTMDERGWIAITSPKPNSLIAGRTAVNFVLQEPQADTQLLKVDCHLNGKVIDTLNAPPYRFVIPRPGSGPLELKLKAYFMNQTYTETAIALESVEVDDGHETTLGKLQVVALDKKGQPLSLENNRLVVKENGRDRRIAEMYRDQRPLDLVVLVDTSFSMMQHIYEAQHAVVQFLDQLTEQEAATVYTFDEKVLAIKRFENNLEESKGALYTLTPNSATALHDALVAARSTLLQRANPTKAIIVIGDGEDTASVTTAIQVEDLFDGAPIRIYSLMVGQSVDIMERLARQSGGTNQVLSADKLESQLNGILAELRNLYFVSYHSEVATEKKPRIRTAAQGNQLRHLRVDVLK